MKNETINEVKSSCAENKSKKDCSCSNCFNSCHSRCHNCCRSCCHSCCYCSSQDFTVVDFIIFMVFGMILLFVLYSQLPVFKSVKNFGEEKEVTSRVVIIPKQMEPIVQDMTWRELSHITLVDNCLMSLMNNKRFDQSFIINLKNVKETNLLDADDKTIGAVRKIEIVMDTLDKSPIKVSANFPNTNDLITLKHYIDEYVVWCKYRNGGVKTK